LVQRESDRTLVENEEASYRALLREVIESRGAAGSGVDLTHLRREKKKKREAERGGSKGRKLRWVKRFSILWSWLFCLERDFSLLEDPTETDRQVDIAETGRRVDIAETD
jgi:hypothetical protein